MRSGFGAKFTSQWNTPLPDASTERRRYESDMARRSQAEHDQAFGSDSSDTNETPRVYVSRYVDEETKKAIRNACNASSLEILLVFESR